MQPALATEMGLTCEEVAEQLSFQEQRRVTVEEVRVIEFQALRKLRCLLASRGWSTVNVLPNTD